MAQGKLNTAYFNPRTPRGVRPPPAGSHPHPYKDFNPRTPRGVRPALPVSTGSWWTYFNPRTPRGVRQTHLGRTLTPFQSRTPREVRPNRVPRSHGSFISSTRRRKSSVIRSAKPMCGYNPHAPRSAADRFDHGSTPLVISIHAPAGMASGTLSGTAAGPFNPRTREGAAKCWFKYPFCGRNFNPHPRGCDTMARAIDGVAHFNPHRYDYWWKLAKLLKQFQSTHPREEVETRQYRVTHSPEDKFQSTHPARVKLRDAADPFISNLFQSTHPARGATANFTKEQRVCLAQFAYLHKGKKAEHTKTNAPMLH